MIDYINSEINCCGIPETILLDEKVSEAIVSISDTILNLYNKSMSDIVFSSKKTIHIDNLNDIRYLIQYLIFIDEQRTEDNDDSLVDLDYYEDYCLKQIKRYFTCRGINIEPVLASFNLLPVSESGGIGEVIIEGSSDPLEIN